ELSAYEKLSAYKSVYAAETPENYFESFAQRLQHRIALAEETRSFAALASLDKENCFVVDEAYFETLAGRIKDRVHSGKPTGILVRLESAFFNRKMAYAAGLCLVIGLSLFYFLRTDGKQVDEKGGCGTLACLEKKEIINSSYLKT